MQPAGEPSSSGPEEIIEEAAASGSLPQADPDFGGAALDPSRTFIDAVLESILTPGASSGLVATINAALIALLFLLFGIIVVRGPDVHMIVLSVLGSGLLFSLNYYIGIVRRIENDDKIVAEASSEPSGKAKAA